MKEKEVSKNTVFKIVPDEKNLKFPEVPDVPVLTKKPESVEVPDLVQKKQMIEPDEDDEIKVDPSSPNAPDYIRSQINKIDKLLEVNVVSGTRLIFNKLKRYVKSAKLSEKQKKLFQYELERLDTAIALNEI